MQEEGLQSPSIVVVGEVVKAARAWQNDQFLETRIRCVNDY
jgi:siroheme synthase